MKWALVACAGIGAAFGGFTIFMGHDGIVIPSVFTLLGTITGYIFGKATSEETL